MWYVYKNGEVALNAIPDINRDLQENSYIAHWDVIRQSPVYYKVEYKRIWLCAKKDIPEEFKLYLLLIGEWND